MKKIHIRAAGSGLNLTFYAGALEALEELGYEPDTGAGTSGGGDILSAWCAGLSAKEIQALMLQFMPPLFKILDPSWLPTSWYFRWGVYKMKKLQEEMRKALASKGVVHFKDMKVPFACFTTNMRTGMVAEWSTSKTPDEIVGDRVVDGSRLPVAMQPGWINGDPHRDGGLVYNYPIDFKFPVQNEMSPTVGLLFRGTAALGGEPVKDFIDDTMRCLDFMLAATAREHIEDAHWANTIVIEPTGSPMDFLKSEEQAKKDFKVGYDCVKQWFALHGGPKTTPA
jgi:predicted acylesterase/phospholipase RssA